MLAESIWNHPQAKEYPLPKLVEEFGIYLLGRAKPASEHTVKKYTQALEGLLASVEASREPLVLQSLTPAAGDRWVAKQRKDGLAEDTIASRQYAVKAFSDSYVCDHLGLTEYDQLARWKRLRPPVKDKVGLTDLEIHKLIKSAHDHVNDYIAYRNEAMLYVLLSTGIRLGACHKLTSESVDPVSGEFTVTEKGGRAHRARLSPAALRAVRKWLRERKAKGTDAMWTTEHGYPITYNGMQIVFWRLKKASGLGKVHAHLLRHTFGQHALRKTGDRALVQRMLGHTSAEMTLRYTRVEDERDAAARMPMASPV